MNDLENALKIKNSIRYDIFDKIKEIISLGKSVGFSDEKEEEFRAKVGLCYIKIHEDIIIDFLHKEFPQLDDQKS